MTKLRLPLRPLKSHAGEEALDRVWERIERTRVRHRRGRQAIALFVPIAAMVLLYVAFDRPNAKEEGSSLVLSDRSKVRVEEGSRVRVAGNSAEEVRLVLEQGRAEFDVDPNEGKRWSIDCGLITVEVVGTRFSIVRTGDRVDVSVERGVVRVVNDRVDRLLIAGDRFRTGEAPASAELSDDAGDHDGPSDVRSARGIDPALRARAEMRKDGSTGVRGRMRGDRRARGSTEAIVDRTHGDASDEGVVDRSRSDGGDPSIDRAEPLTRDERMERGEPQPTFDELLERADQARVEGNGDLAIALLEQAIERSDPRAGIAAFTLGRLRFDEGSHAKAAAAFERALLLGVPSALLEGAMSRTFEAHQAAGDQARAMEAAKRYLERFPRGRQAGLAGEVIAR